MERPFQIGRYELKYIIDEVRACAIRSLILMHMVPDSHADRKHHEYRVHSLYLDGPGLDLYRATLEGRKNRYKLRIRFYDEQPESPVMVEVKRRQDQVLIKQRAAVRRSAVPRLLAGHWPVRQDLVASDGRGWQALEAFCRLRDGIVARGSAFITYTREAYVMPGNSNVRVTFDRQLAASLFQGRFALGGLTPVRNVGVILELKFDQTFPGWLRHLIQIFDLERTSMCKYAAGLLKLQSAPPCWRRPIAALVT